MKDTAVQYLFLTMSVISGVVMHLELNEVLTIVGRIFSFLSFIVILIANWERFTGQLKTWIRGTKNEKND